MNPNPHKSPVSQRHKGSLFICTFNTFLLNKEMGSILILAFRRTFTQVLMLCIRSGHCAFISGKVPNKHAKYSKFASVCLSPSAKREDVRLPVNRRFFPRPASPTSPKTQILRTR